MLRTFDILMPFVSRSWLSSSFVLFSVWNPKKDIIVAGPGVLLLTVDTGAGDFVSKI